MLTDLVDGDPKRVLWSPTSLESAFSPDYTAARARFRSSALRLGARLEEFPIGQRGPDQEPLTDVAVLGSITQKSHRRHEWDPRR